MVDHHIMSRAIFRRRLNPAWAFAVGLLVACSARAGVPVLQEQIDALARPLIADGTAVGMAVGVMQEGRTLFLGYGETAKGSRTAPDLKTPVPNSA